MSLVSVICPACNEQYMATTDNGVSLDTLHAPECLECFITNKIFAPDEVKAWLYLQLKAFPYAIVS